MFWLRKNKLLQGFRYSFGRSKGRIVSYHRGGGNSLKYFYIDNIRNIFDIPGIVCRLYYSTRYNCKLGLVLYTAGYYSFIKLSEKSKIGDLFLNIKNMNSYHIYNSNLPIIFKSCFVPLRFLKTGLFISNIQYLLNSGSKYSLSYGSTSKLILKTKHTAIIRLASRELKVFNLNCRCVPTELGKSVFFREFLVKAGQNRHFNKRPVVRGVAMNPVDHPHGGGEGKTSGGRCSTSPWGWLTKGPKTRKSAKVRFHLSQL